VSVTWAGDFLDLAAALNTALLPGANVTLTYDGGAGTITIASSGGGGGGTLADGDYGDITASATGTVLTIDANAVTLAKLADIATSSILGRVTAATGDPEVLTATQVRTLINVANGATANSADATLLARGNHTGTQTAATIGDFTTAVQAVPLTHGISGYIESPTNKTYPIVAKAARAFTIVSFSRKTSTGSITCSIQINGVAVTSLVAVSATTTLTEGTAGGLSAVAAGNRVTLVTSANASAADLEWTLKITIP
jgi:hypothetical protein